MNCVKDPKEKEILLIYHLAIPHQEKKRFQPLWSANTLLCDMGFKQKDK
jgi:hypothetical protein